MRALSIDHFGPVEDLRLVQKPRPEVAVNEVLVRVVSSAINPVDDKTRNGDIGDLALSFPFTLGWELAGVVVEDPTECFSPGAPVIGMSHQLSSGRGTWAEMVALPVTGLASAPTSVGLVEAGTLPLPGSTALQVLDWLDLHPDSRLLVAGAAGAVGGIAVQVASSRGIQVDAVISRESQIGQVSSWGAESVVTDAKELPTGSYTHVFDTYGADVADLIANGGRFATIATQAGSAPDLTARSITAELRQVYADRDSLRQLVSLVDRGVIGTRVDSVFPASEVVRAHRRFTAGGLNGKVALTF